MKIAIPVSKGANKAHCEDTAFCNGTIIDRVVRVIETDTLTAIGVADGVGGNAGGRNASRFIASQISAADFSKMGQPEIKEKLLSLNYELILDAAAIAGKEAMATTLTCVIQGIDAYYLAHLGNTRIFKIKGSYLRQLSVDHTTYNWLLRTGQSEAAEHCNRSEIISCFGGGNPALASKLIIQSLNSDLPETLVLTSDGIHDYVDVDTIEEKIVSNQDDLAVQELITQAEAAGSTDDKTIIIIRQR